MPFTWSQEAMSGPEHRWYRVTWWHYDIRTDTSGVQLGPFTFVRFGESWDDTTNIYMGPFLVWFS